MHARLANGPKSGSEIKAEAQTLDIPERSLIEAADALGVRSQRGQWWLPEVRLSSAQSAVQSDAAAAQDH